jgi:hypothetical protein
MGNSKNRFPSGMTNKKQATAKATAMTGGLKMVHSVHRSATPVDKDRSRETSALCAKPLLWQDMPRLVYPDGKR